jgi:hypothetical protein
VTLQQNAVTLLEPGDLPELQPRRGKVVRRTKRAPRATSAGR